MLRWFCTYFVIKLFTYEFQSMTEYDVEYTLWVEIDSRRMIISVCFWFGFRRLRTFMRQPKLM